jgi:hypothetical protein
MRKLLILAAGIGILFPNVAWSQSRDDEEEGIQVGDYAPDIEAKEWLNVERKADVPSLVELRGMVVVLFFWVSWHEGGERLLPHVNVLAHNSRIGEAGGAYIIGITDADRKATQSVIDEAKVFFPVGLESKSAEEYGFQTGFGFVVVDPEGKVVFKGSGGGDLQGTVNAVIQAMEDSPPSKTHPTKAKACYRYLDSIRDHLRDGKYYKVRRATEEVALRAVLGDRLASEAVELSDLANLLGYEQLARLEPLLEKEQYVDAAGLLRFIIRHYRGLDVYKDAKRLNKELQEENEQFKDAVGKFENEDTAAHLLLDARDELKGHKYTDSYDTLQKIVTEYPKTEAAEYAEAMLARMKRNRNFWSHIVDHQAAPECRTLLAEARNLIAQRRYREAERKLQQIMRDHPDTTWAQRAKEELKKIP